MAYTLQSKDMDWLNGLKNNTHLLPTRNTNQQAYTQTERERIEKDVPGQEKGKNQQV